MDLQSGDNSNLLEVPVRNLRPGMYISQLDRPWLDTPFAVQGFYVGDANDIDYVARYCSYVYVDPRRKAPAKKAQPRRATVRDQVAFKDEYQQANGDFESASAAMERVFKQISSNGRVDIEAVQVAVTPLIDSVFRNREALAALVRLKDKSDYFYSHSLGVAVWSAVLGRHLGIAKETLVELALAATVMDVGMTKVSENLLAADRALTTEEFQEVQGHVRASLKLLRSSGALSNRTLNVVACHHERLNGEGYPRGLKGKEIPVLARIVGLADTYDAMISERSHAKPRSSFEAMQELQDLKDTHFQASLVEHFVQSVGLFPTGTIVELNTGDVGVVVQQNPTRRLRPKIVLILNAEKSPRNQLTVVDLSKYANSKNVTPSVWITAELSSGAYGISPNDYFL